MVAGFLGYSDVGYMCIIMSGGNIRQNLGRKVLVDSADVWLYMGVLQDLRW